MRSALGVFDVLACGAESKAIGDLYAFNIREYSWARQISAGREPSARLMPSLAVAANGRDLYVFGERVVVRVLNRSSPARKAVRETERKA